MTIILSRKGLDSDPDNIPSPILPDGTLLSLPIQDYSGFTGKYEDYAHNGKSYKDIISELAPKFDFKKSPNCHLDPDIRQDVFTVPSDWKSIFGQNDRAQSHLKSKCVGIGDLFLFFGRFRRTAYGVDGKLQFAPKAQELRIIYGYLQVGDMIKDKVEIQKYDWHPHAKIDYSKNCLYIARETCSWNPNIKGYGVFSYNERLLLTKDGGRRSNKWKPHSMKDHNMEMTGQRQEHVIQKDDTVERWAKSLIDLLAPPMPALR